MIVKNPEVCLNIGVTFGETKLEVIEGNVEAPRNVFPNIKFFTQGEGEGNVRALSTRTPFDDFDII
jgi:hypothetical protein